MLINCVVDFVMLISLYKLCFIDFSHQEMIVPNLCHVSSLAFCYYFVGGVFKLELFLPEEYPMAAPKVF